MLVKEIPHQRKMLWKLLLHYQHAMDLMDQRELTAERSSLHQFAREINYQNFNQERKHHADSYQRIAVKPQD
jgi:uncharacterized protein (DUF305 family)